LGDIGPLAGLPVMEGKSALMKAFAGVDSVPIVVNETDPDKLVEFLRQIAPSFAGINLEDISAPRCFEVERRSQHLGIPVFHDDQHGTAIVVAAALRNAAKVVGKEYEDLHVVVVGAGAAGIAVSEMLLGEEHSQGVSDLILVDREGAIYPGIPGQNRYREEIARKSNKNVKKGSLTEVIKGADVVIGVSGPGAIEREMVESMAPGAIVFAMANPTPEIMPDEALAAGAAVVATGRSDYPNQINNVLVFPGFWKGVVDGRIKKTTPEMMLAAVDALSGMVIEPSPTNIIPGAFDPGVAQRVAEAVLSIHAHQRVPCPDFHAQFLSSQRLNSHAI
jgi:malate dehydrogenase (oxaloacetate-decarboxylating)